MSLMIKSVNLLWQKIKWPNEEILSTGKATRKQAHGQTMPLSLSGQLIVNFVLFQGL